MHPLTWLGNDIVALNSPEAKGKSTHARFIERVCTPEERARMFAAHDPDTALWAIWSAKEAAFKAVAKSRDGTVFSPRRFVVTMDGDGVGGSVMYADLLVRVRWEKTREWVHCVALLTKHGRLPVWPKVSSSVCKLVPEEDGAPMPVPWAPSRQVRALAIKLLAGAGLDGAEIVRDPRGPALLGPPYVLHMAQRHVEVSLSHDGEWIAAAILANERVELCDRAAGGNINL